MEALVLASVISCADGEWILSGLSSIELSKRERSEIRTEIILAMPKNCSPEQYNPSRRK
jgi:hypothetical protein|tara:strand:+ start:4219 stop:4395 length:177 start_codon:yes stop_codon:yes gene_type:complete